MNTSRFFSKLSAFLLMFGALVSSAPAAVAASDGPYKMEVLINGVPAKEYHHRGKDYLEARRGREYSVRLTNQSHERVAVALAVDGLNSIDAKHTSAAAARKWILGPYESIVIDGWQTSSATARQFFFTNEASSYGAWLGKTRDLGNITAAFFQEQRPEPRPYYQPDEEAWDGAPQARLERSAPAARGKAAAPSAGASSGSSSLAGDAPASGMVEESKRRQSHANKDELAATGIGRERDHQVYTVEFRQKSAPTAVIAVRYEFREKLIEMGIIRPYRPHPMSRRETSGGFTDYGYAPDPYRSR